jgi:GH25 family lysozyme M1 (1,4-beta-N-acetylmuramidase)
MNYEREENDMLGRGSLESPFLLEALPASPSAHGHTRLVRQLAAVSRRFSPAARAHVERALFRHLTDVGVRDPGQLGAAVDALRRAWLDVHETEAILESMESFEQEGSLGETPGMQEQAWIGTPERAEANQEQERAAPAIAEAEAEEERERSEAGMEEVNLESALDEAAAEAEWPLPEAEGEEESPFLSGEALEEAEESEQAEEAEQDTDVDLEGLEETEDLVESESEFASLSASELKAVRITSTFETGHAGGFGGLTANIDGQGLSFGLMNWTINAGSLIPLLQEFIRKHEDRFGAIFGADAQRFKAMVFATRRDPKTGAALRDVAAQMDFARGTLNDAAQKNIVEPWKTYFRGLENDPDFRRIEVAAARAGLRHAKRWFDHFGFKTERGFVFLFDLVSSHGAWWLDARKFGGKREKLLAERLAQKQAITGHAPTELETLEVIANMIADISLPRWREQVRVRKLWFVHGTGRVHGTAYDITRNFGVTDAPPDLAGGSAPTAAPVATPVPTPTPQGAPPKPSASAGAITPLILGLDTASVGGNKNPDWVKARTDGGLSFAIIRSNWGTARDSVFARDWPKIKDAGLLRGAYLFLRFPHSKYKTCPDPAAQAHKLIETLGALEHTDLPPSLDVEFPGGRAETRMSPGQLLEGVRTAWKVLKDHYGVAPILYTSGRVWQEDLSNLPAPDLVESPLWLARYPVKKGTAVRNPELFANGRNNPPVPPPWGDASNWWIHQYQGDALRLPGFPTGDLDMNRFNAMGPGASGDRVRWAQRRLGIAATGSFDAVMATALAAFQARHGLTADARIDPRTFALLCWSNP